MANFIVKVLHRYGDRQRALGIRRCDDWAGPSVAELKPAALPDIVCGGGSRFFNYLKEMSAEFYGVEGAESLKAAAEKRGLKVVSYDLNGRWPFPDNKFDVVFSNQVIEHLHNTRLFVEEAYRVLKPGGTAIIASENLCSLLNWGVMTLGYTPFSLMQLCGHIRVMTVRQAQEIFTLSGFQTEARSVSILPLPDAVSRMLEPVVRHRGHYLTVRARKPL